MKYGMYGCCSLQSVSLANAEFDSMGDIVEGGVGIPNKTSPRRTAIQKVQVELRQECDFRDERRRELEFLENGGNPLDFKLENVSSVSVQSMSCTDQHPVLFETSEAKVSFAGTVLPHGDSAESSGRPGTPHGEASSADNLMLFAIEREVSGSDRSSLHLSNSHVVPSEQSFQTDVSHKTMEPGDSAAFDLAGKAYKRRYRSHTSRDRTRSSSTDVNPSCGSLNSSFPFCHGPRDIKEFVADSKYRNPTSNCNSKSVNPIGDIHPKMVLTEGQRDTEFHYVKAVELDKDLVERISIDPASYTMAFGNPLNDQHNQQSLSVAIETPKKIGSKQPDVIQPMQEITSGVIECQPSIAFVNQSSSCQLNDFSKTERDEIAYDSHNNTSRTINGMGYYLPCTQNNPCADTKTEKEICRMRKFDSNGNLKNQTLDVAPVIEIDGVAVVENEEVVTEKKKTENFESSALFVEKTIFACQSQQNGIALQPEEELNQNVSTLKNEARNQFNSEDREASRINGSESGRRPAVPKFGSGNDEDSILKEAKIIEEKRKRIMELLIEPFPVEIHVKSKWDFVLEEMAWMANDFAQERIWKIAAASELCYRATFSSRLRKQEKISVMEAKKVAHTLSKAVIGFWHSVKESSKELDNQQSQKTGAFSVLAYAVRFLKYNTLNVLNNRAEFPPTPDRTSDLRTLDVSWEENLTDEYLFYTIPPGAIEMYKKSIESHVARCKRIGASAPEEVETSACDTAADFAFQENMYEEEMSTYDMAVAYDNNKPARFCQNKRKQLTHAYGARSFDVDSSLLAVRYTDNKVLRQPSSLMVKRPCSSLNVSIPTKRVRTAYRRVTSPFSAGTSGCILRPNKTEASSGDTSSFQDDHNTLHGVSLVPNSLESELGGEYGKQLPLDTAEVSTKSKKRSKHLLQRVHWKNESDSYQIESNGAEGFLVQPMMKMLKMQQPHNSSFDDILPVGGSVTSPVASQMSNMSNSNKIIKVIVAHDRARKPKAMKMPAGQPGSGSPWSLFEDQALVVLVHDLGPNWELISDAISGTLHFKYIFRKPKVCKERHHILMDGTSGDGPDSAEDSGSSQPYRSTLPGIPKGSARQLFQRLREPMEEDTLNSHFDKIIMIGQKQHYRKTEEPKQLQQPHRSHAILLSQVSPNNLSGGPVLTPLDFYDATIVGPDMLAVGNQGQLSSVLTNPNHGSVAPMLSASGASSTFHGSSTTMLGISLQSSPGSLSSNVRDSRYGVPRSASISIDEQQRMQQYSQVISGRNSSQHNTFAPGTLPVTDHVRILSGGNGMGMISGINKSMPTVRPGLQGIVSSSMLNSGSMLSPVVASAKVLSVVGSGQGSSLLRPREPPLHMMQPGMVQGSQRQMMVPDIQMQLSPGSQGMPHFGGLSSPSPNQTTSSQLSSFSLYNQQSHPVSPQQPPVISPRTHFQASARSNVQQQAYAIHLAKERQTRQRLLQQQPQQLQLVASNSLIPHVHSSPQFPISSPVQTSPQVQPEMSSPSVSVSPLTSTSSTNSMPQQQQKQHTHTQGGGGNAQTGGIGLTNQISKQRQRQQQQFSLANRQHPQQRQLRQQTKVLSGVGRGNPILHQIVPIDQSQLNGFSTNLGNECLEKGEPATPLVQSQGLCTGSTQNSVQPPRQYMSSQSSNQSLPQKKECSGRAASSPKHPHQMTYHSDTNSQGHVSAVAPTSLPSVQQSVSSLAVAGLNHPQVPPPRNAVNQIKSTLQRVSQPNRSINSEPLVKPQANEFDTGKHQSSGPSEMDRLAKMESNASLVSAVTNSSEPVPRAGQGLCQRPSASSPPLRHDVSAHWHQRPSHVQQYQPPVAQTQHPPLQRQQQQPLLPLHSQLQTQLHQTVKNNLYGSPGDTRI
ncbi:LOW QUALITY PROTEIN: chromatin modification-related protein EAF1 B-like [Primulina tabacum]|uniref:LOW QUALITY PROTEIN: chromatin modification-related protein EAF1 B-like n=1 Tax=Primulina tabacum TaxID=48773 RepID=UPI003F5AB155